MRYKTLLFIACLSVTLPFSAQQFSLGVRAGRSLSDEVYYGQYPAGISQRDFALLPGFHAGIEGRLQLTKHFALSAELQYAQKGYNGELYWPSGPARAHYTLHYATLPVLGNFKIWKGLSAQAGVEAAWLIKARTKSAGESFDPESIADLYRDFDLGVVAGIEYQFGKSFFVNVRHIAGATPRSTVEITDENGGGEKLHVYNSSTQFSVGYRYYFGQ